MLLRQAANGALLVHLLSLKCKASSKALILFFVCVLVTEINSLKHEMRHRMTRHAQLSPVEKNECPFYKKKKRIGRKKGA